MVILCISSVAVIAQEKNKIKFLALITPCQKHRTNPAISTFLIRMSYASSSCYIIFRHEDIFWKLRVFPGYPANHRNHEFGFIAE
jgi:hypothetical protein